MFTIKVKCGDDLRRFQTDETKLSWASFQQEIVRRFELDPTSSQLLLKYEDEEGDRITISSDAELREALSCSLRQKTTTLKLELSVSHLPLHSSPSLLSPAPLTLSTTSSLLTPSSSTFTSTSSSLSLTSLTSEMLLPPPSPEAATLVFGTDINQFLGSGSSNIFPSSLTASNTFDELGAIFRGLSPFALSGEVVAQPPPTPSPQEEPKQEVSTTQPETPSKEEESPKKAPEEAIAKEEEEEQPLPPSKPTHEGVMCDSCHCGVVGVRYKCGHCPDFDLCEACEASPHAHPATHLFIKIPTPIIASTNFDWITRAIMLPPVHFPLGAGSCSPQTPPSKEAPKPVEPISQPKAPSSVIVTPTPPPVLSSSSSASFSSSPSSPPSAHLPEAKFLADVTITDGTVMKPGSSFTKTWCLKNTGDAKWPLSCRVKFVGGTEMGALHGTMIASPLPGDTVNVSVLMTAPSTPGRYVSHWRLHTPQGKAFGHRVWCDIVVQDPSSKEPLSAEEEASTPAADQPAERTRSQSLSEAVSPSPVEILPIPDDNRYEQQMKSLLAMGFCNRTTNLKRLRETQGNLEAVVEQLLLDQENNWFQRH